MSGREEGLSGRRDAWTDSRMTKGWGIGETCSWIPLPQLANLRKLRAGDSEVGLDFRLLKRNQTLALEEFSM